MNVRKTDEFMADVERQFEWYAINGIRNLADRYLDAVEATGRLRVTLLGDERFSRRRTPKFNRIGKVWPVSG